MPGAKNSKIIAPATVSPDNTRCLIALGRTPDDSPIDLPPLELPLIIARRPR
jgi:hypothetical protein